jgi:CRP-like cAMP-binding protein
MISSVDYFKPCSNDTIEEISYYCEQVHYDKDNVVFRAGDPIDKIYFVVSGKVNIIVNIHGRDIVVDTLHQGCSIGANGVLGNLCHNFSAKTMSTTSFYCISKDHLSSLLNTCEDLDREVYKWKEYYEKSGMPYVDFR